MPTPLRSESVTTRKDIQFKHFGVMNTGEQSKASLFTSLTLNIILLLIALVIGAASKKIIDDRSKENVTFSPIKPIEPPKPPKIIKPPPPPPPKVIPPAPPVPKITQPTVIPEPPKIAPVPIAKPVPVPAITPTPPKVVVAAAAPKVTQVNMAAKSASNPNNDPKPTVMRMGQTNNPLQPSNRPATQAVNLGVAGGPHMTGSGNGPASTKVEMGNGNPGGSLSGTGRVAVQGVNMGTPNGTGNRPGNGNVNRPAVIALGTTPAGPPAAVHVDKAPVKSMPTVIYKPTPTYTAEATAMHLEGTVSVRVHVAASGAVSVVGVTSGLGHGLDESAVRAAQGTRFRPAIDAAGNPTDSDVVIRITFQMAG